ncbi:ABC transporter permease [Clostridium niameyense]|uniref:ABC transporter permease n=1 Tax=Clostridium niameyense TaxID=1622073 RepID=A0A6M0RBT0_9CLOT|nr:ABC transporter permease [Clostridium niameyense]NEZ47130.1 ABC transporter permease [Clostridium niameyense]
MERILSIIGLEINKKGFLKKLIFSLIIIIGILFLSIIITKEKINTVPAMLLKVISYVILANYSVSLTEEFTNKTDKIIFTGIFTRSEIMTSKLIKFIYINIISFIFYEITLILSNSFNKEVFLNNFYAFIIYAFTLGSFILLVSSITSSTIITGVISYILYFDLTLIMLSQALIFIKSQLIRNIIENSPFYIVNTGFYLGNYTGKQSILMIIYGLIFLSMYCAIINKKDI